MLAYIRRELYFVNNLWAKILIRNNIINFKGIILDIINKKIYIDSYKITIKLLARLRDEFIRRKIYVKSITLISLYSEIILLTRSINLSINRDFLFESSI